MDEAGCGPLAGPVVAGAVVFSCAWLQTGLWSKLRGLNDSKQLTEEQREKYFEIITTYPEIRWAVATVEVDLGRPAHNTTPPGTQRQAGRRPSCLKLLVPAQ